MEAGMDIDVFLENLDKVFDEGGREDVGKFLRDSISEAEADNDLHALITVLTEAAGYFRNTSDYAEAITAADRAVSLLRDLGFDNSVPYGTGLLNAATAYRAAGDSVKALELFILSLTVLAALLPEDDHRLAGLYNNISAIHQEKGQYPEALEMLEKASAIMERNPEMADDAAVVLTNLAMVQLRLDQPDEAVKTLERAMDIFRRTAEGRSGRRKFSPQYAAALAGMGEVCYGMGHFLEAAQRYESALEHIREVFGENREYAVTCRNCADAYRAAGQEEKARARERQAKRVLDGLGEAAL
jgi:tetratricopeptide (TPR) repeat protein